MRKAVLLDLAGVAMDGHARMFEALKSVLLRHGVMLTPAIFGGCFVDRDVGAGIKRFLAPTGREPLAENLTAELQSAVDEALSAADKAPAALRKAVAAWRRKGAEVGLSSTFDTAATEKLVARLQLADEPLPVHGQSRRRGHVVCTAAWKRATRSLRIPPSYVVAVVASAASHRGALFAGMNTVVLAGSLTGGQDFGGADAVVADFGALETAVLQSLGNLT